MSALVRLIAVLAMYTEVTCLRHTRLAALNDSSFVLQALDVDLQLLSVAGQGIQGSLYLKRIPFNSPNYLKHPGIR